MNASTNVTEFTVLLVKSIPSVLRKQIPITVCFFGHLGAVEASCEHIIDILSPFNVDMANSLPNSCLFTYPAVTKQHYYLCGVVFVPNRLNLSIIIILLAPFSCGKYLDLEHHMFTGYSITVSCLVLGR